MVVIQGHKTYFVSYRLHLPHGVGEEEPTATFCHINYMNINGNGRMQHTINPYTSNTACCLSIQGKLLICMYLQQT